MLPQVQMPGVMVPHYQRGLQWDQIGSSLCPQVNIASQHRTLRQLINEHMSRQCLEMRAPASGPKRALNHCLHVKHNS